MRYRVQVLSSQDFDNLPYPDTELSLGIADPSTNHAYIRYTGLHDVDKYLVNHEVEHLIDRSGGEHSEHYRNGVYYKHLSSMMSALKSMTDRIGTAKATYSYNKINKMASNTNPFGPFANSPGHGRNASTTGVNASQTGANAFPTNSGRGGVTSSISKRMFE